MQLKLVLLLLVPGPGAYSGCSGIESVSRVCLSTVNYCVEYKYNLHYNPNLKYRGISHSTLNTR